MKNLSALSIQQPFIALFGSGHSILDLSESDFEIIKSQCFIITINYAPVHLKGHLNMWSDRRVSDFMIEFFKDNPKETLCLAQQGRVPDSLKPKIDFWFNRSQEKLKGNYTIAWALQLLQKYFPDKTTLLFGVDMYAKCTDEAKWYDRYTDYDQRRRGNNYNVQAKLNQCADQIARYCTHEKVFNCNPQSGLAYFPKKDWRSLLSVRVLHLCATPLAGAPAHLSKIINKYTPAQSRSVLKANFKSPALTNLRWDYDIVSPSSQQLKELIDWADIVHFHRKVYAAQINGKPDLIQYHSPPNGYRPKETDRLFNGRKLVIAQYHPRYYTDAYIVPNLIDIWAPMYLPGKKASGKVKIFYSWATETKGNWSDKGSSVTQSILKTIKEKYKDRVEICIYNNRSYQECMAEKRSAHIVIDECVTGSYHLQSLEGCSVGAVTFNNIDEKTQSFLSEISGQTSHPFEKTGLEGLHDHLCFYIDHPEILTEKGRQARVWMEQYWDPRILVHRYLKVYTDILQHGQILVDQQAPKFLSPDRSQQQNTLSSPAKQQPAIAKNTADQKFSSPAHPLSKLTKKAKGRSITELAGRYKGEDIYIFGTGPSIFEIDPEDYRNRLCFGINFAFEIMPYIDYHFVHVIEVFQIIRKQVDNKKLILPESLVPQWYRQQERRKPQSRIPPDCPEAFIYPIQDARERNLSKKHVQLDRDTSFFTWSTTSHSAIHVAAYMGAKRIFLIGMDYQLYPNGKVHFESEHYPEYGQQDWNANKKHKQGDEWLARMLKNHQVEVINQSFQIRSSVGKSKIAIANES